MFRRLEEYIPKVWTLEDKKVVGLNERMRVLRYDPGEKFEPHYDGSFTRGNGEKSYITVQLYLSDNSEDAGCKGGSTRFFHTKEKGKYIDVVPKPGRVVIFQHRLLHSGEEVRKGRKYTVRTDVMYESIYSRYE
eukprot:GFYU01001306.1.p1 GENE.GFYU01001306.1~~GFYU01001306.1.p1  ORF type:complete len:134 (-),score=26.15 GFYU01001306.1:23-424(-)